MQNNHSNSVLSGNNAKRYSVAIVGASGAVGREVIKTLYERKFPLSQVTLFTSARSAGGVLDVSATDMKHVPSGLRFEELKADQDFSKFQIVFFTSGSKVSEAHAYRAASQGAYVIDNASLFRMRPDVPLVVPEVNGATLEMARHSRVIANPNCTTAQMVMALKPLHDAFKIKRVVVASYQAVSGKGQQGIDEFRLQVQQHVAGKPLTVSAFPHPIAFNCLPHIDVFRDSGFTGEEEKVMAETQKILGDQSIKVVATCVRVPVENCHSESVTVEFERSGTLEDARRVLAAMPGVRLYDDPATNQYPLASIVSGEDDVYVGRLRVDPSLEGNRFGLTMWVVGDNLRKGAALNAVQIGEALIAQSFV